MLLQSWDEKMRPLVAAYGPGMVWNVGLDLFMYPPTWDLSNSQIEQLREACHAIKESKV